MMSSDRLGLFFASVAVLALGLAGCSATASDSGPTAAEVGSAPPTSPVKDAASESPPAEEASVEGPYQPYNVQNGTSPDVVEACDALDIGHEVFATVGESTLRSDSAIISGDGTVGTTLLCVFGTGDVSAHGPSWISVSTVDGGYTEIYKLQLESSKDMGLDPHPVDVADKGVFWSSGETESVGDTMLVLDGDRGISVQAYFQERPAGTELNEASYEAIIRKILQ